MTIQWKYVMLELDGGTYHGIPIVKQPAPIIFTSFLAHKEIGMAARTFIIREGHNKFSPFQGRVNVDCVGAGFLGNVNVDYPHGRSESLDIESDGVDDTTRFNSALEIYK